jgi:hypothetical protein
VALKTSDLTFLMHCRTGGCAFQKRFHRPSSEWDVKDGPVHEDGS